MPFHDDLLGNRIVVAPMAGGPSTLELVIAASRAGALAFLAAGYKSSAAMAAEIRQVRESGVTAFGVNVFVPGLPCSEAEDLAQYLKSIGAATEAGTWDDDDFVGKITALLADPPPLVSFTFGCPDTAVISALRDAGSAVLVTVTSPAEAQEAAEAGADALCVQGIEAGAHRGTFVNADGSGQDYGLLNQFMLDHPGAPAAYPEINNATRPLRAAAAARGDTEQMSLWAGQGYRMAADLPAAEIVGLLSAELP